MKQIDAKTKTTCGDLEIEIAGEPVTLAPERAAWWRDAKTLLIADLHLGKSGTLRAAGAPIPSGDATEQLERLSAAVDRFGATRVIVVGDLLHAPAGLRDSLIDEVAAWRRRRPIDLRLVPGNHDKKLERVLDAWSIELAPDGWRDGPFAFRHDPADARDDDAYVWSGHTHPAAVVRTPTERLRLPAFVIGERSAVLPAFSRFTGGARVRTGPDERLFAIAGESVMPVPS